MPTARTAKASLGVNNHSMYKFGFIVFIFRQHASETERLRAAKIAALPPPVDPIGVTFLIC